MKYLKTKHQKNSAKITTLIVVILVLLCFVIGQNYQDPPNEYGVAVNFGNSEVGSGNIQPDKPVKSKDLNINKQPNLVKNEPNKDIEQVDNVKEKTTPKEVKETILTQEKEEAIAIKSAKEAKAKKLAEVKAKEEAAKKAKANALAKKKAEEEKKRAEIDAIMGGINNSEGETNGSEGNDNKTGDKGQLNGNPYAPYKGIPGSGNGGLAYGLNGRGKASYKILEGCENEYGLMIVNIVVNRAGEVIEATPGVKGTTNTSSCLKTVAQKIAFTYKWKPDPNAPFRQYGKVSINFSQN